MIQTDPAAKLTNIKKTKKNKLSLTQVDKSKLWDIFKMYYYF